MIAAYFTPAQLVVLIGTIFTGMTGCITAYAAVIRAKKETHTKDEIECLERLKAARLETTMVEDELQTLRRKRPGYG